MPTSRDRRISAAVDDALTATERRPSTPLTYSITGAVLTALDDEPPAGGGRAGDDIPVLDPDERVENSLRRHGVHAVVELLVYPVLPVRGDDREPLLGLRNLTERGARAILDALVAAGAPHPQDATARSAPEQGRRTG